MDAGLAQASQRPSPNAHEAAKGKPMERIAPVILLVSGWLGTIAVPAAAATLRGRIVDADGGKPLPARLYVKLAAPDGKWFFVKTAVANGSAVEYRKERSAQSAEMHTTLSAHEFTAELPPGKYTLTAERGKEYLTETKAVEVGEKGAEVELRLRRWIDMAARGWFSGDTHVHRALDELPNVVLAEDLNVALPLTYWVTTSGMAPGQRKPGQGDAPAQRDVKAELIRVGPQHIIWPINTEYEIFTTAGRQHTLGAVFVLGHQRPLALGVPPVGPVAEQARREGAILDLDKHSWPWSLMIVPVMKVDLFELSNNHVWRTAFAFRDWTRDTVPAHMGIETDGRGGFTEWGWIDFGFKTYYALLDCGFRLRPTAGTASGVHPVPLGFGRVYIELPDARPGEPLDYAAWMKGLNAGRSFVTTGPMLLTKFNAQPPGTTFAVKEAERPECHISGSVESSEPPDRIEIVVNGQIARVVRPLSKRTAAGGYSSKFDESLSLEGSSWVAVRCFENRGDRIRFSHTAPVHFDVPGKPLRPRRADVEYFLRRMEEELARNKGVLAAESLNEYQQALDTYRAIGEKAR
jgi:hypothetical protein